MKQNKQVQFVTATQLASLAKCQRQAVLDVLHGNSATHGDWVARQKGLREHLREELRAELRDRARRAGIRQDSRCYIATAVYGPDAPETQRLRDWRDRSLLPSPAGRCLVHLYYRLSPAIARLADRRPTINRLLRRLLNWWLKCLG